MDNTQHALDDTNSNYWYKVDRYGNSEGRNGNHWDDWSGHGSYDIPGTGTGVDRYPFLEENGWSISHGGKHHHQQYVPDPPD